MEIILKTQKGNFLLETGFDNETKKFVTIYTCNKIKSVLERFDNINEIVPTHDFWCKITGLIPQPISTVSVKEIAERFKAS